MLVGKVAKGKVNRIVLPTKSNTPISLDGDARSLDWFYATLNHRLRA